MGIIGILFIVALAWFFSVSRKRISIRPILVGMLMQFLLGLLFLKTSAGTLLFKGVTIVVHNLIECADIGAAFIFGQGFGEHFFAFSVLPAIIFFSSLTGVLFYGGILPYVVKHIAHLVRITFGISGPEALSAAANIFVGQIEAPMFIKGSIASLSKTQLYTVSVCGMSTISGSLLAVYANMGVDVGYLLTANIMSLPAALVISKLLMPDDCESVKDSPPVLLDKATFGDNIIDSACKGAMQGLKIALAIGACVLCFVAFTALLNKGLSLCGDIHGMPLTLERIFGFVLRPVAWLLGVPWNDCPTVAQLLGKKLVFNEFIAYVDFTQVMKTLSPKSVIVTSFALCGFSNISSIAIMIAGLGSLAPEKRAEITSFSFRAMIGGTMATYLTACIAGLLM